MISVTFRKSDHTYWDGDRKIPGVTTVMKPLCDFSHIREEVLSRKSDLGTAVHLATELHDENDLDWSSLTHEQAEYTKGWVKFCRDNDTAIVHKELRVFHPTMIYAGTLDRIMWINGVLAMLDIKTSATMSPATGVQTAAYLEAYKAQYPNETPPSVRYGLQLNPDGTYRLHKYESNRDWPTFLSLLTIFNWMKENAK